MNMPSSRNAYRQELIIDVLKTLKQRAAEDKRLVEDAEYRKKHATVHYHVILAQKQKWRAERAAVEDQPDLLAHPDYKAYQIDAWLQAKEALIRLAEDVELDVKINKSQEEKKRETPSQYYERKVSDTLSVLDTVFTFDDRLQDKLREEIEKIQASDLPDEVKDARIARRRLMAEQAVERVILSGKKEGTEL